LLGVFALAILAIYGIARRRRTVWAPVAVRILAAGGLVLPAWTILVWYRELSRALEWVGRFDIRLHAPVATESVTDAFLVNSMALLTLGFVLMVAGIFLAHRLDAVVAPDEEDLER